MKGYSMIKQQELNSVLAEVFGLEIRTVNYYARELQKAGLLPVGKKGFAHTGELTEEHAVTMILALMAAPNGREAPLIVKRLGRETVSQVGVVMFGADGRVTALDDVLTDPEHLRQHSEGRGEICETSLGETLRIVLYYYAVRQTEFPPFLQVQRAGKQQVFSISVSKGFDEVMGEHALAYTYGKPLPGVRYSDTMINLSPDGLAKIGDLFRYAYEERSKNENRVINYKRQGK